MCYTPSISLQAFMINLTSSAALYMFAPDGPNKTSFRIIAIYFFYLGWMQLFDYLLWIYPKPHTVNAITTKLAMLASYLQPVIYLLIASLMTNRFHMLSLSVVTIYVLYALTFAIEIMDNVHFTTPIDDVQGPTNRQTLLWEWLQWDGPISTAYVAASLLITWQYLTGEVRNWMSLFILASFAFSRLKYSVNRSIGRFWCYFGSFVPLLTLIFITVKRGKEMI